jgi:hypothetical protein
MTRGRRALTATLGMALSSLSATSSTFADGSAGSTLADSSLPACTAQALDGKLPGVSVGKQCIPNPTCVDACSESYGEALATSPQQSPLNEETCAGDYECMDKRAATVRVYQADAMSNLSYCLSLCWKDRAPGTCRHDSDCPAKGPCQPGSCEDERCTTVAFDDQTACQQNGNAGVCRQGACVSPETFLRGCGDALGQADGLRKKYQKDFERCHARGTCASVKRMVDLYRRGEGQGLIKCVEAAVDASANQAPSKGGRSSGTSESRR